MSRGARWTIIAFILLFGWMLLSDWSADSSRQRVVESGLIAFMLALALGLAAPGRFRWALRVAAGMVAVGYFAYFVSEVFGLLRGDAQELSVNRPNATAAGVGLLLYGVPALIFALGAERVGLARLFGQRSGNGQDEEQSEADGEGPEEHADDAEAD
jgi:hypothetical protein